MKNKNIVLIGMPSAGKSTIGQRLASNLNMSFLDTDDLIFDEAKKPLKDIVSQDGLDKFLELQEKIILNIEAETSIIATGGSVVKSKPAIEHLKNNSIIVYLKVSYSEIESRLGTERRLARKEEQDFLGVYNEREVLYQKYSDIVIDCTAREIDDIISEISKNLNAY